MFIFGSRVTPGATGAASVSGRIYIWDAWNCWDGAVFAAGAVIRPHTEFVIATGASVVTSAEVNDTPSQYT